MADFDEINQRFRDALQKIGYTDSERAVTKVLIQVEANTAPMVPIDTSALINSMYRYVRQDGNGWRGDVGFGARYAEWVHDMPGTLKGQPREDFGVTSNRSEFGPQRPTAFGGGTGQGNYWDPNAEPRFLEKGIEKTIPELRTILREEYSE